MSDKHKHIVDDELIAKVLSGEASAEEQAAVESWAGENGNNKQLVEQSRVTWAMLEAYQKSREINVDHAWAKLSSNLFANEQTDGEPVLRSIDSTPERKVTSFKTWRIAAAIAVIVSLGTLLYNLFLADTNRIEIASGESTKEILLADGTRITLNKNSTLTYPEEFEPGLRNVELEGEAFFEVSANKDNPFVIDVEGAEVKVLGTTFNVSAYEEHDTVSVTVMEGVVSLRPADKDTLEKGLVLRMGSTGKLDKKSGKLMQMISAGMEELYWKTKTLIFKKTELKEVVKVLSAVYQAKVVITSEGLGRCRLSTTFSDEPLESVLQIIADTYGATVRTNNGRIEISGDGC